MSDKVFLDIVNMSITGSFAILIIILRSEERRVGKECRL